MCPETDILEQEKKAVADMIAVRAITRTTRFSRGPAADSCGWPLPRRTARLRNIPGYRSTAVSLFRSGPLHFHPGTGGGRKEIGLIEDIRRLPGRRGPCWRSRWPCGIFTPVIQKIHSIKEENGFSYWDTETDRGACRFTVRMGGGSVYAIRKDQYLVTDLDGNRFEIPELGRMSARELKMLDLFV